MGVLVERCRYLEQSGCASICINSCKVPTQVRSPCPWTSHLQLPQLGSGGAAGAPVLHMQLQQHCSSAVLSLCSCFWGLAPCRASQPYPDPHASIGP
jgi:hypothetical protein